MRKIIFTSIVILFTLFSCERERERRTGNACISLDKTSTSISELVTVSNCGDDLPTQYITLTIDWGDGTVTPGQTGTHSYKAAGTYQVRLFFNGTFSADIADVDASKVSHAITVQ